MSVASLSHVVLKSFTQIPHELCPRGNSILVKLRFLFLSEFDSLFGPLAVNLLLSIKSILNILGSSESSRPLLIHLGSRGYSINSHVNNLLRLDNSHKLVDVEENSPEHFRFTLWTLSSISWLSARMNDAIHVKVKVVYFRIVCLNLCLDVSINISIQKIYFVGITGFFELILKEFQLIF